jgi:hypothetical protein
MKPDITWRKERDEILVFTETPKGAAWIAKHLTTNIHDTIHCVITYGEELLSQMKQDGLVVNEDK